MGDKTHCHDGMDLRKALSLARRLGCLVKKKHGTGEYLIAHQKWLKSITINGRKDAPRALTMRLRRLIPDAPVREVR